MLTVGSLFSGIGGIEYGLERTGHFKTIWHCEIEAYPSAVLRKHWPDVPNLGDITRVDWSKIEKPDVICGGFPCQDISIAGKGAGIVEGKRSGLWSEYAKAIRILRPRYALVENVPELANRGLWLVLADLAEMGYDAEWGVISAESVGAPHRRERIFIVAYLHGERHVHGKSQIEPAEGREQALGEFEPSVPIADSQRLGLRSGSNNEREHESQGRDNEIDTANTHGKRMEGNGKAQPQRFKEFKAFENIKRIEDLRGRSDIPEPLVRRTGDGLSDRLERYRASRKWKERIKALGNAVVPACAEVAGRRILEIEAEHQTL